MTRKMISTWTVLLTFWLLVVATPKPNFSGAWVMDRARSFGKMRDSFATSGWTAYLREIVSQDWGRLGTSETRRASLLAELGDKEEAIASLATAAARGDYWLFSIRYDPAFDPLRGDPRFQDLLKKFNPPVTRERS
jgi:hypothetical protein